MKVLVMLAALAMLPRLLAFLSGSGRSRIKIRMRRQWGPVEWLLIAAAVGTLLVLGSCGLL